MKTELVRLRCLPTEKQAWEKTAGARGFSRWARAILNEAARTPTGEQHLFDQDDDDDDDDD